MTFDDRTGRRGGRLESQLRFYKTATVVLLALVVVLSAVLILGGHRRFARAIRLDGELICLVNDQAAAARVHDLLIEQGKGNLPGEAALVQEWVDEPWPVEGHRVLSVDEAVEALKKRVVVLVDAFTIQVDGQKTIALPTEQAAKDVLDALKASYLKEGEKLAEPQSFLQDVKIAPIRVRADQVVTEIAEALKQLKGAHGEPRTYIVQAGDFPEKIAAKHNMTIAAFYKLNPGVKGRTIHPGDKVKVSPAMAGITVKTVKEVTRTVELAPEVEEVKSMSLPRGQRQVVTEGTPGKKQIIEHHVYHNDRCVEKKIILGRVIEPPLPRRVLVGIAEVPAEGSRPTQ
jgi:LysM repeat protein